MTESTPDCCAEYARVAGLTRRSFLQRSAVVTGGLMATQVFGEAIMQSTYGATTGGNVLVVLSMRGGMDGLGMVVPYADPAYAAARPTTAIPTNALLAQDSFFGLHPSMQPLLPAWNAGQVAAVHAVGLPQPNRSHFSAIEEVEDAAPGSGTRSGWINRMIGLNAVTDDLEAVALGDSILPSSLKGPENAFAANDLSSLQVPHSDLGTIRYDTLDKAWANVSGPLADAARSARRISSGPAETIKAVPADTTTYPGTYPGKDLGDALQSAARLIRADVGTDVITIDFGSWDMHDGYGTIGNGRMHDMVGALAGNLAAFLTDLGPLTSQVTVVTITEFGRRVAENGNSGFDHGWGNAMLVAGAGVKGGAYYASWPGLGSGSLVDGDLKVTTDYRSVLSDIVAARFPDRSLSALFPNFVRPTSLGFVA